MLLQGFFLHLFSFQQFFAHFSTSPPINWTSKCRNPNVRQLASRVSANDLASNEFKF
jgi:hypothetical protein